MHFRAQALGGNAWLDRSEGRESGVIVHRPEPTLACAPPMQRTQWAETGTWVRRQVGSAHDSPQAATPGAPVEVRAKHVRATGAWAQHHSEPRRLMTPVAPHCRCSMRCIA